MAWNEEDQSDLDPEGPDAADLVDEPAEVPCPYCRRPISEEAERCPCCGSYVSTIDAPVRREWWWVVALVLLILLLFAYLLK